MGKANGLITGGTPGGSESSVEVFTGVYMWIVGTASQTDVQSLDLFHLDVGKFRVYHQPPHCPSCQCLFSEVMKS